MTQSPLSGGKEEKGQTQGPIHRLVDPLDLAAFQTGYS